MIRLYDRVVTQGYWVKDDSPTPPPDWLKVGGEDPPAVLIDNVADYYFAERRRRDRLWHMEDFPNLAPPWPTFWVEWRPKQDHERDPRTVGRLPKGIGVAFHTVDLGEDSAPMARQARWQVRCGIFIPDVDDEKVWAIATYQFYLDRDGAFVQSPFRDRDVVLPSLLGPDRVTGAHPVGRTVVQTQILEAGTKDEHLGRAFIYAHNVLYPALLSITFAHCRNVELVDVPPAPPRFARAYQRRRGRPLGRYQTLLIEPATRLLRETGQSETDGVPRALHICRGHFATYGKDGRGLLFGKRAGTFWIPTHERGQADAGVVVSDYEVRPAEALP